MERFGSSNLDFNFSYGGKNWGNFISANGLNTGRFLDPPEFVVFHAKGNEENFFDRFDYVFSSKDAIHLNAGFTRSWFQNPNSYDQPDTTASWRDSIGQYWSLGPTDQRSKILTYNIAPTWTHTLSNNAIFTVGGFVRSDHFNYYPSADPFADLGPIQQETVAQQRSLTERRGSRRHHVYQGHSQHQGWLSLRTDLLERKRSAWNCRSHISMRLASM